MKFILVNVVKQFQSVTKTIQTLINIRNFYLLKQPSQLAGTFQQGEAFHLSQAFHQLIQMSKTTNNSNTINKDFINNSKALYGNTINKDFIQPEQLLQAKQVAKELHTRIHKDFQRRAVISNHPNEIWAMDLCEIHSFPNFKYILTVIDVYTKFGYAIPLKNKKGSTVAEELNNIISTTKNSPLFFWFDKGKEFYNKDVEALCKKYSIKFYSVESEIKCSVVERWNRTLKERMEQELTLRKLVSHKIVLPEILDKIVHDYNNSVHSTIKMKPIDAIKPENLDLLAKNWNLHLKGYEVIPVSKDLNPGDFVRIYRYKTHFENGYKANWTTEIFKIKSINYTFPVATYIIEDLEGEEIKGGFYKEELLKSHSVKF